MRKNYLVFPAGRFGAALLLMRVSAAAMLGGLGLYLAPLGPWLDLALIALVGALLLGFCTRAAAGAGAVVLALAAVATGSYLGAAAALHAIDAAALCLLGAGAYSADSRLFGRRVITLPD